MTKKEALIKVLKVTAKAGLTITDLALALTENGIKVTHTILGGAHNLANEFSGNSSKPIAADIAKKGSLKIISSTRKQLKKLKTRI